jgi:hypothetical protein
VDRWIEREAVIRRYDNADPSAKAFLQFSKWAEYEANTTVDLARTILEVCLPESLEPEESRQARVFQKIAMFEERERVRMSSSYLQAFGQVVVIKEATTRW